MEIIPSLQHHPQTFSQHPKPTEQIVRQIRNFIQDPLGNDPRSTSEIQEDFFNLPYEIEESTGTQHQTAPKSSDDMAISNHAPRHFPTPYVALYSAHCHLEKFHRDFLRKRNPCRQDSRFSNVSLPLPSQLLVASSG